MKQDQDIEKNQISVILMQMAELLRQWNYSDRAIGLEHDADSLDSHNIDLISKLSGPTYWGGSGSYFDIYIVATDAQEREFGDPNLNYRILLLDLLERLNDVGVVSPRLTFAKDFLENSIKIRRSKV